MAAVAYASLLSLTRVLDRIQQLHFSGKILLDSSQAQILRERLQSLITFLEKKPNPQNRSLSAESLCRQISLFAREAKVIIDEQIVNQLSGFRSNAVSAFTRALDEVIQKIGSMELNLRLEQSSIEKIDYTEPQSLVGTFSGGKLVESSDLDSFSFTSSSTDNSDPDTFSSTSSSTAELVKFENRMSWVIDKLTDHETSLQVIPIVGMGGIGKTNLALSVYDHPKIQSRFDRRLWCIISQEYDVKQIIQGFLEDETNDTIAELGKQLYQKLHSRRFLIVMDDVWSIKAWEGLRPHLPDNRNGSRIIITTRNSNLAGSLRTGARSCALSLLDDLTSWNLLVKKIFGESGCCPDELQELGNEIAKYCRGLPLSLVTIAGLLSKSDMTVSFWKYVAKNVKEIISSTNNEHCLNVLSLSYLSLPMFLKPCFLYFRFSDKANINVRYLIQDWIGEGFVKPVGNKRIECVAEEYLKELVDRNLIMVQRKNLIGKIKECSVHDLVLELCIRESVKEGFDFLPRLNVTDHQNISCLMCSSYFNTDLVCEECKTKFRFLEKLRPVNLLGKKFPSTLRFINSTLVITRNSLPPPLLYFWDIHSLSMHIPHWSIATGDVSHLKFLDMIWEMSQLRYLTLIGFHLPEPTTSSSPTVSSELQILHVTEMRFTKEIIIRIPYLKKLKLRLTQDSNYSLHLLECFDQLQSFSLIGNRYDLLKYKINYPFSLNKLTLENVKICWDETMSQIGSLPNLEVLKLINLMEQETREWSMNEGGFTSLKVLVLQHTKLNVWVVESGYFPVLSRLVIEEEEDLAVPSEIGDIDTLSSIHLKECGERTCETVKELLEVQYDYGNETLQVFVDGKLLQISDDS